MASQEPRYLLIETRLDGMMREHELGCLVRASGLDPGEFTMLDATQEPLTEEHYDQFDAVFIGGTGDYSVAQDRPAFFQPLVEWTLGLLDREIPTLGLCYGFHLMAHAVGGKVETRPDLEETGTFDVTLTMDGQKDPILDCLPRTFPAQQGHHDVVLEMPGEYVRLAESVRCRWQAFRHPEKPFYGLQFHPELRRSDFMDRMIHYAESYASTPEIMEQINARVRETENEEVVKAFLRRIVGDSRV